jgi:large subunit ribosomal protein L21
VEENKNIVVERIEGKEGDKVTIKDVNLISDGNKIEIGRPVLSKVEVKATIRKQIKGDKVIAFKYKPKKRYRRKVGHRQLLTILHLDKINMK